MFSVSLITSSVAQGIPGEVGTGGDRTCMAPFPPSGRALGQESMGRAAGTARKGKVGETESI